MRPTQQIDHFLPVRFKRGTLVKQFSKPCVQCGEILHGRHMHGIARMIDDHFAVAATATCPSCQASFGVACVIDDHRRVRRISLPVWGFKLYLRLLKPLPGEDAAHDEAVVQLAREAASAARPLVASVDYPRADAALGQYQGKPIPAHIVVDGREVPFDRIEPEGRVTSGEYLLDGYLVYKFA